MELEPRRVLSADFSLGAEGLLLDGFDTPGDTVAVSRVADQYQFRLGSGGWTNTGAPADGVAVYGGVLSVEASTLAPLAGGIHLAAAPGTELEVLFDGVDFSDLAGPVTIDGASTIGQTAGSTFYGPAASVLAFIAPTAGLELNSLDLGTDLLLEFNGPIIDAPNTQIRIDGDATIISRPQSGGPADLNGSGVVGPGDIAVWAGEYNADSGDVDQGDVNNDAFVNAADYTALRDLAGGTGGDGGITLADNAGDVLEVTGKATFIAQSESGSARFPISIGVAGDGATGGAPGPILAATTGDDAPLPSGAQVGFGSLAVFGADTTVFEASTPAESEEPNPVNDGTLLEDSSVASLHLVSAGPITDTPTTDVAVTGPALFDSTTDEEITLIATHAFGTLTLDGGVVVVNEADDTVLSGVSRVGSLLLTAMGSIGDDDTADFEAQGLARFVSSTAGAITLDDTHNFGRLQFDGGAVDIREASGTFLSGVSNAVSLNLVSSVMIEGPGVELTVDENARFEAPGGPIELMGTNRFGSLTFNGGVVTITEAGPTVLSGKSDATRLELTSIGPADASITDDGTADLDVTGIARFIAINTDAGIEAGPIILDEEDDYDFGSLSFSGGAVTIVEQSDTLLADLSTAATLDLVSGGDIADDDSGGGAFLSVTGNARFTSVSEGITLDNGVELGSLTFSGGAVEIAEIDDVVLSGESTADTLLLTARAFTISDDDTANVVVMGNASFTAPDGVDLDDQYAFGSLTFNSAIVDIVEQDGTELAGDSAAGSLRLESRGSITDAADATLAVATAPGSAVFLADGSVVLGDAGVANQIAIFDASFTAGASGGGVGDVLIGVNPDGTPSDATVLITLLNFNAPGSVRFGIDGGVPAPAASAALVDGAVVNGAVVDEALSELVLDDLAIEEALDPFAA